MNDRKYYDGHLLDSSNAVVHGQLDALIGGSRGRLHLNPGEIDAYEAAKTGGEEELAARSKKCRSKKLKESGESFDADTARDVRSDSDHAAGG